jgi:cell wall-associated NlpC family hydrolase
MFMMNASEKNVIYATGNEIFDRIDGTPGNSNPFKGTWLSRADKTLAAIFDDVGRNGSTGTCKLTFTNQYKNTPLPGKSALTSAKKTVDNIIRANSPSGAASSIAKPTVAGTSAVRNKIIDTAKKYQGKRYQLGSTGMNTFDCSGFAQTIYKEAAGVTIPRSCAAIQKECKRIKISELKVGDLILFDTNGRGAASHVAIYLGNNEMIHSYGGSPSTKKIGVAITKMEGTAYNKWWKPYQMFGVVSLQISQI